MSKIIYVQIDLDVINEMPTFRVFIWYFIKLSLRKAWIDFTGNYPVYYLGINLNRFYLRQFVGLLHVEGLSLIGTWKVKYNRYTSEYIKNTRHWNWTIALQRSIFLSINWFNFYCANKMKNKTPHCWKNSFIRTIVQTMLT